MKELAKRTQHLATSEYAATKMWPFFKLDPNVCNTRRATMLRLAGPLYTCHVESTIFQGSIKYIHTFLHSLVRITSLFFRGGGSIRKPDRSTNLSVVKLKALKLRHMYVYSTNFFKRFGNNTKYLPPRLLLLSYTFSDLLMRRYRRPTWPFGNAFIFSHIKYYCLSRLFAKFDNWKTCCFRNKCDWNFVSKD